MKGNNCYKKCALLIFTDYITVTPVYLLFMKLPISHLTTGNYFRFILLNSIRKKLSPKLYLMLFETESYCSYYFFFS